MQDGFVNTSFGRLHYLHAGTGNPLILLHSNGNSAYEYEFVIEKLAKSRRVIAWDMPGQGDSDALTRHHTVPDYAQAVVEMMTALGLKRASVLGASIGGSVCVALGARHAEQIDKLVIVETPARTPEETAKMWFRTEQNYSSPTQTAEQLAPRFRRVTPEFLARWNIDRNKAGVKTMLDVMWALREYDVVADLPKIKADSLLVFGDKGPTVGKLATFTGALPRARVEVFKDCGHFPMIDAPDEFAGLVDEFLGKP